MPLWHDRTPDPEDTPRAASENRKAGRDVKREIRTEERRKIGRKRDR